MVIVFSVSTDNSMMVNIQPFMYSGRNRMFETAGHPFYVYINFPYNNI